MTISNRKEALILLIGDILVLAVSLYITLGIRILEIPSLGLFILRLKPFGIVIAVWVIVYFIAGLYEKHTVFLKSKIPSLILNAQLVNSALATLFFYLIPYFGISPKVTLFIYLVITFGLMILWRIKGTSLLYATKREAALLVGSGDEMKEVYEEVNNNPRYGFYFISSVDLNKTENIDFQEEIMNRIYTEGVSLVVLDLHNEKVNPILHHLYKLIFSNVQFIDIHKVYEDLFNRVPLSLVRDNWFLENISVAPKVMYDILKRAMDIVIAIPLFIISIPFQLIAVVLIKLDDNGPVFFRTERIGKNNKPIEILKFRSMTVGEQEKISSVGKFLRKSRIDELPQLWNVLRGDLSLIGPRPELVQYVKSYEEKILYYNVRHLIKPGLSGWAQLYHKDPPKFSVAVDQTKTKLSFDLYYIKNRSFMLDLKIALQTIKTLLSKSGI